MEGQPRSFPQSVSECQFRAVGCDERIRVQDQEEHSRQSILKHVQLTAAATVSGCQQLYDIICQQGKKQSELDDKQEKLYQKVYVLEQQQMVYHQEKQKMLEQIHQLQIKLEEENSSEGKLGLYQGYLQQLEERLKEHLDHHQGKLQELEKKMVVLSGHQQTTDRKSVV